MAERTPTQAEIDATVARTLAEAEKFRAETRRAVAQAEQEEIARAGMLRKEKQELNSDLLNRIYIFDSPVMDSSVKNCMRKLAEWSREDGDNPGEIEIIFNSPGGDIISGMALYDYITRIKKKGHYITTSTMGTAASMAGILLQVGDKRMMGAESWMLIHEAQFGAIGSFGEVEDQVQWIKQIQERILDIFTTRSNLTKAQIKKRWSRTNWWLDSDEALRLGLIDEIG